MRSCGAITGSVAGKGHGDLSGKLCVLAQRPACAPSRPGRLQFPAARLMGGNNPQARAAFFFLREALSPPHCVLPRTSLGAWPDRARERSRGEQAGFARLTGRGGDQGRVPTRSGRCAGGRPPVSAASLGTRTATVYQAPTACGPRAG